MHTETASPGQEEQNEPISQSIPSTSSDPIGHVLLEQHGNSPESRTNALDNDAMTVASRQSVALAVSICIGSLLARSVRIVYTQYTHRVHTCIGVIFTCACMCSALDMYQTHLIQDGDTNDDTLPTLEAYPVATLASDVLSGAMACFQAALTMTFGWVTGVVDQVWGAHIPRELWTDTLSVTIGILAQRGIIYVLRACVPTRAKAPTTHQHSHQ